MNGARARPWPLPLIVFSQRFSGISAPEPENRKQPDAISAPKMAARFSAG